jgi:hypothetical protein
MREVVEFYGDGFTPLADTKHVLMDRPVSPDTPLGSAIYFDFSSSGNFPDREIRHMDRVVVNSILDNRAVVFFEGAVDIRKDQVRSPADYEVTNRVRYSFTPGIRISTAIHDLKDSFTQVSDLANAYIRRIKGGENLTIPVNIEDLLLRKTDSQDVELANGDFVIIPFRQYFVTVAGAVMSPGRYPYVPDRTWKYYVNLAGGIDKNRNSKEAVEISSKSEEKREKTDFIEPEDKIYVESNDFVYRFSRVLGVVGHIASVVTMVLGVIAIFGF